MSLSREFMLNPEQQNDIIAALARQALKGATREPLRYFDRLMRQNILHALYATGTEKGVLRDLRRHSRFIFHKTQRETLAPDAIA